MTRVLRIALYHNLGAGGGKRHLFEHARGLVERGHECDLFVPASANEIFLPLATLCREVKVYGAEAAAITPPADAESLSSGNSGRLRRLARTLLGSTGHDLLAEWHWARRHRARVARLAEINRQVARDIDAGGYDVAYVHQCALTLAPDVLRFLARTPTAFVCNDTPRWAYEWALDGPAEYDAQTAPFGRRKQLGRWLSPVQRGLAAETDRQFVENTRAATLVLSNSSYSRECTVRATGANPRVCYPGVDTDFYAPDPTVRKEVDLVVSVGALLPTKQHDFILRSVATIPADRRPRLEIIGYESPAPGDTGGIGTEGQRLRFLAKSLGIDLIVRSDVSDVTIRSAYRRATVVAFAPYLEPFGLVALEAMACGTPVVAVREGGPRETIQDSANGYLTDRDPTAFGNRLDALLTHPQVRSLMADAARASAVDEWTWGRSVSVAEGFLQSIAKKEK